MNISDFKNVRSNEYQIMWRYIPHDTMHSDLRIKRLIKGCVAIPYGRTLQRSPLCVYDLLECNAV